jgi:hypothetical protein
MNALVLPETLKKVDALVDKSKSAKASRGKIVDSKFHG